MILIIKNVDLKVTLDLPRNSRPQISFTGKTFLQTVSYVKDQWIN